MPDIIDASGLAYKLGAMRTAVERDGSEVMAPSEPSSEVVTICSHRGPLDNSPLE